MKDLAAIGKARDAARQKAQTAVGEFKKLVVQYNEMANRLGIEAEQHTDQMEVESAPKAAAKASASGEVRLKKDGTPKKKPGPKASGVKAAAEKVEAILTPKAKKSVVSSANGVRLKKDGTPKKKPGPKASGEPVVKATAVKTKAEAGTGKKKNRAAEGRRAVLAGERPSLKDGIRQVMGSKVMSTQEVYDALKAKGWLPNSNDPKGYVGYTLSADKKSFDRVPDKGRGFYRLKEDIATPKKETTPKKDTDTVMEDARAILGVN
jgi:hypothetical protein